MNAKRLQDVTIKQLELAEKLFGEHTRFQRLLTYYDKWHAAGLCTKHHTYDSVFFIVDEGVGFRTYKFYHGGIDIRVGSLNVTAAEAYTEAICSM